MTESLTINTTEFKEVGDSNDFDLSVEENLASSSGRDSGISNDYKKEHPISPIAVRQPSAELINQVEEQLQNIVFSSQKELYDAKQKLEELRLLRFEEKSTLVKEIEQWKDKVKNQENNFTELNERLTEVQSNKDKLKSDHESLIKEKAVANEINMMQEQEIVRLEMKLKSNEISNLNLNKQIDQQRKLLLDRDKTRLKQQDEISNISIKLHSMEESLSFYRNQSRESESKVSNREREICDLQEQLADVTAEMELSKNAENKSRQHVKHMQTSNAQLRDEIESIKLQLREERDGNNILRLRFENKEIELKRRVEQLENSFTTQKHQHEIELARKESAVKDLQQELENSLDERDHLQKRLHEIQFTLKKHMTRDMLKVLIAPISTEDASTQYVSCEDIDNYFTNVCTKLRTLQLEVEDVTSDKNHQILKMGDLNDTILGLKNDLETAHVNLASTTRRNEGLDEKYDRLNETFQIQERDIQRKVDENISLRRSNEQAKEQIAKLQKELNITRDEISTNQTLHREEKQRLKFRLNDLENKYDKLEKERSVETAQFIHEKNSYETNLRKKTTEVKEKERNFISTLEEKDEELKDLRTQLNALIDDNKNLAQRLIHLESYSEKLTSLLEVHQNEKEELKSRFEDNSKEFGEMLDGKNQELETLFERINKLNLTIVDNEERFEKAHGKLKYLKEENKNLSAENQHIKVQNKKLNERIGKLTETLASSENKIYFLTNEVTNIKKQFEDQKGQTDLLMIQIEDREREKVTLQDELSKCEKRTRMKESLIVEMAKKSSSTMEGYNSLKKKLDQLENADREKTSEIKLLDKERINLERSLIEKGHENAFLADQLKSLHDTLYRTEDEKEKSIEELTTTQRKLETVRERNEQILIEARDNMKHTERMNQMQSQIDGMKDELYHERRLREKLESINGRKYDQVAKLKSSFNQSLNTLTSDTKNIKKLLGKSLEKLDKQIRGVDDIDSPSSDVPTDTDKESVLTINEKFFGLPDRSFNGRRSYDGLKDSHWKRYSEMSDVPERDVSSLRKSYKKKLNFNKMTP